MRYVATALAAVLYALGWLVGAVAVAVEWVWSAVAVGWDDVHAAARRSRQRAAQARAPEPPPAVTTIPAWPAERPREAA